MTAVETTSIRPEYVRLSNFALAGVMVGAAFGVAEVNTPFRYTFRYPVLATVRLETRWHQALVDMLPEIRPTPKRRHVGVLRWPTGNDYY